MPFNPGASTSRTPADQTATDTTTYENNGYGAIASIPCTLTPGATGRVMVMWSGDQTSNATAQTHTMQMVYGTGAAPANNTAVSGTAIGGEVAWVSLTGQLRTPFSIAYLITGLTLGTTYYFDIACKSSAGNVALKNVNFLAFEV